MRPLNNPHSRTNSGCLKGWGLRRPDPVLENPSGRQIVELLNSLPAAIYTTDADGRITFYNKTAEQLWGCRPALGDSKWCGSWRLFRPDGTPLPHSECPMAVALKEGRAINGMEVMAERPDGRCVRFIAFPTPLHR